MTNQEKLQEKLFELIKYTHFYGNDEVIFPLDDDQANNFVDSILHAFPQILADKVWEGENKLGESRKMDIPSIYCPKGKYQIFIREVKE